MIHVLALITGVVVFPDRAQVTRSEKTSCGQRQVVSFGAIPPSADPGSFRAQVEGGSVDGLRVEKQVRSDAFGKEAQEIDDQVEKLDGELRALDDARERDRAAAKLADE